MLKSDQWLPYSWSNAYSVLPHTQDRVMSMMWWYECVVEKRLCTRQTARVGGFKAPQLADRGIRKEDPIRGGTGDGGGGDTAVQGGV